MAVSLLSVTIGNASITPDVRDEGGFGGNANLPDDRDGVVSVELGCIDDPIDGTGVGGGGSGLSDPRRCDGCCLRSP
jgi:hypothetical protein